MTFREEFSLLLRACYPLLYIPTLEEERVEGAIAQCAANLGQRTVYTWDFVDGYQDNPNNTGFGKRNPLQALEFIEKLPPNIGGIFILRDFQRFLEDIAIARKLRNLARRLKAEPKNIVIVAPEIKIPADLAEVLTIVKFPLPTANEIRTEIERLLQGVGQTPEAQLLNELVRAAQGLSLERIRRVLTLSLANHGQIQAEDVELILAEKRQSIRQTQILDFYPATEQISDIGGLDRLKEWLLRRGELSVKKHGNMVCPTHGDCCSSAFKAQVNLSPPRRSPTIGIYPCCALMWDVYLPDWLVNPNPAPGK